MGASASSPCTFSPKLLRQIQALPRQLSLRFVGTHEEVGVARRPLQCVCEHHSSLTLLLSAHTFIPTVATPTLHDELLRRARPLTYVCTHCG